MTVVKLSLIIPYKRRLANLRIAFEGLARQTMDKSEFEVVVGAMEYCDDYVATCREFADRINIISILTSADFEIPRARNLAMKQASGQVFIQMDADTLLPPGALRNLYERYFSFEQMIYVAGQVSGYENNEGGDVLPVESHSYGDYQDELARLETAAVNSKDVRMGEEHVIPWAFAWTGLLALPAAAVQTHDLFFDEEFRGWGVDDLEWGYRICASGIPIVLKEDVRALHLPHARNAAANRDTERANYRRFLRKWPAVDVELACAFGDVEGNRRYREFRRELSRATAGIGDLITVRGVSGDHEVLLVGVLRADGQAATPDPAIAARVDVAAGFQILPLTGLALPYADGSIEEGYILPPIAGLSRRYRDAVRTEVERVTCRTGLPPGW